MAFKEMSAKELSKTLGIDTNEVNEKQKLIARIIKMRKDKGITQTVLAKRLGITQGRVAQIESGIGTAKITFDVLFHILSELGFGFQIRILKTA